MLSIDRVRDEILSYSPPDALIEWVNQAPNGLFVSSAEPLVIAAFTEMVNWVQASVQFRSEAKAEFARVADGWLAAYARIHNVVVVTQEVFNADVRKRVPLPNVCKQFGVDYRDTFEMLRELEVSFDWRHSR